MFAQFWQLLTDWGSLDSWIVATGAVTAMACSLPGLWLVLRRQSMMGDALSHTALPGLVLSILVVSWAGAMGWIAQGQVDIATQIALIVGAVLMGMITTLLTEWLQNLANIDGGTALGVIFTGLFACGLVLLRVFANDAHIDAECVLFGRLEEVLSDTWSIGAWEVPKAACLTTILLVVNLALTIVFFKELRLASFDAELATTQGVNARLVHYTHMALTAATVTAAFQNVGSILVIALLVVPAVTALQLTWRLRTVVIATLVIACVSAVLGHVMAKTLPAMICGPLGWPEIRDASSSGMISVAAGMLFVLAAVCGPRGLLVSGWNRLKLTWQIAEEDVLGSLYRTEESSEPVTVSALSVVANGWLSSLLLKSLKWRGLALPNAGGEYQLTSAGQTHARDVVRRHRLWESYMQKHFALPDDHLHETAHRIEHYIDPPLQQALSKELDAPEIDPHGKVIPSPDTPEPGHK